MRQPREGFSRGSLAIGTMSQPSWIEPGKLKTPLESRRSTKYPLVENLEPPQLRGVQRFRYL